MWMKFILPFELAKKGRRMSVWALRRSMEIGFCKLKSLLISDERTWRFTICRYSSCDPQWILLLQFFRCDLRFHPCMVLFLIKRQLQEPACRPQGVHVSKAISKLVTFLFFPIDNRFRIRHFWQSSVEKVACWYRNLRYLLGQMVRREMNRELQTRAYKCFPV